MNEAFTAGACFVALPRLSAKAGNQRETESRLEEAVGLVEAIDFDVVEATAFNVSRPRPATLFGKGAVETIRTSVEAHGHSGREIDVIVVDAQLSPVQQRNLEQEWQCKVIDRTGLILEIFGARAQTREGRLQVELAALSYQKSRLVRSWTHLERQRGGAGFMGGPGETQIEMDRRMIGQRIARINLDLKEVRRTRGLHRNARQRVPYPVIALVGYTNAGKSTLFNRLTGADVVVADQLFATLDPTMRAITLGNGRQVILSDTVGFISHLPHELVNAFHATLEELTVADLVLHVRDISHPDTEIQKADVFEVLAEIGDGEEFGKPVIEVLNKIDLLDAEAREYQLNKTGRSDAPTAAVCALTGEGCEALLEEIERFLGRRFEVIDVALPYTNGAEAAWFYEHGEVLERDDTDDGVHLKVRLSPENIARYRRHAAVP